MNFQEYKQKVFAERPDVKREYEAMKPTWRDHMLMKFLRNHTPDPMTGEVESDLCDGFYSAFLKGAESFEKFVRSLPTEKPQPLTIEELRGMDGEPVWVEFEDGSGGIWGIVHIAIFCQIVFADGTHCTIGKPFYGRTYKAYRYHPVATDTDVGSKMDAWEACVECKTCRNCKNYDDYDPYEGTTGECGQCYDMSNFEPVNFCHECGKPLTEEARAMLEKRLRGCSE